MPEHEHDELETLVEAATTLMDRVTALAEDQGVQFVTLAKRATRSHNLATIAIIGIVFDVILSIALAFGGFQLMHLTHRLDVSQTTTRQSALCPLYQLFIDSDTPAAREAAPDKKTYDHSFKVIRAGYAALDCEQFIDRAKPVQLGP